MNNDFLSQLRALFANLFSKTRQQMIYQSLAPEQVDKTSDYVPLEYSRHYLRLWLAQVYLAKKSTFLKDWFPAVHSRVRFDVRGTPVEFPTVADASKLGMRQKSDKGDVIAQNFVLTPLIPFNNGTVEIDAGLSAVEGANQLDSLVTTLSDFSSLLAVPQFSTALNIAAPLAKGLQSLLNIGGVHLALHDAFAEQRIGGYWIALRASETSESGPMATPSLLTVQNDQLRIRNEYNKEVSYPVEGYDYMLFRLEITEKGPDYRSLSSIQSPMSQAHSALKDQDTAKADGFYRTAVIAAHEAPELSNADRIRVKRQLKDDYEELKNNLGYSGLVGEEYDLSKSMERAMTVNMALTEGDPSFDFLFDV